MVDLGLDIKLGTGVAAAQEYYRHGSNVLQKVAAE
jgi:alanine-glyoxylate transaminase/serine-glyoxylate transaminase/serine-pyruvate transaminase